MNGTLLRRASLAATLGMTSHAEVAAGIAGGMPMWHPLGADLPGIGLPWLLPIAIDCYVVEALENREGGDRWAALAVLTASVVGGSVAVADDGVRAAILAGIGTVLVVVLSRLYAKPKPSKAQVAERAAEADAEAAKARAEEEHQASRERVASRRRVEEAEHLAAIDARREQDAAAAHERKVNAEVAAETARLEAATAAEIARIRAQAEADAANRERPRSRTGEKKTTKAPANGFANGFANGAANATPPAKDEAVRKVATAIREHQGNEPYVFDWTEWQAAHGGGKTFWWGVHKAATEPIHAAEATG